MTAEEFKQKVWEMPTREIEEEIDRLEKCANYDYTEAIEILQVVIDERTHR